MSENWGQVPTIKKDPGEGPGRGPDPKGDQGQREGLGNKYYTKTSFATINMQGLLNSGKQKKEAVLQLLRDEEVSVLALQEHWLTKSIKYPESSLEGYR